MNRASLQFHKGRAFAPVTPAQYARYLAACRQPNFLGLLIKRRADGAVVGALELSQIVMGVFRSAYLGYYLGAPYAGQGLMSEAIALVLTHAFTEMGLHRVEANIQPDNTASLALVAKLGFVREGYSRRYLKIRGRWRDHERWAILVEDWRARRG
jgi:[ribosomal protein S5]-alanine N-acetyltransferase